MLKVVQRSSTLIRHRYQLNISRSSTRRILIIDLHLHAYKIQLMQYLKSTDYAQRQLDTGASTNR